MSTIKLQTVIWKEDQFYVAQCLNIDISSFGKTRKEALKILDEALELYLEKSKSAKITKVERPKIVSLLLKNA
jgi:predicted RNase H-like HicB family nuclease